MLGGQQWRAGVEAQPSAAVWLTRDAAYRQRRWLVCNSQQGTEYRILKMIATSGFLTALECTEFVFGRSSAPDTAGELTRFPDPLAGLTGVERKGEEK